MIKFVFVDVEPLLPQGLRQQAYPFPVRVDRMSAALQADPVAILPLLEDLDLYLNERPDHMARYVETGFSLAQQAIQAGAGEPLGRCFQLALRLNPKDVAMGLGYARWLRGQGSIEEAARQFELLMGITQPSADPGVWLDAAEIWVQQGAVERALFLLSQCRPYCASQERFEKIFAEVQKGLVPPTPLAMPVVAERSVEDVTRPIVMARKWQLEVVKGSDPGKIYDVADGIQMGRHEENAIQLTDKKVSRRHAVIQKTAEGFVLRDLESGNGTFVNGQRIAAALCLNEGDVITVGETDMKVVVRGGVALPPKLPSGKRTPPPPTRSDPPELRVSGGDLCPKCGETIEASDAFCAYCGQKLK